MALATSEPIGCTSSRDDISDQPNCIDHKNDDLITIKRNATPFIFLAALNTVGIVLFFIHLVKNNFDVKWPF